MPIDTWFATQIYFEKLHQASDPIRKQLLLEICDLENLDGGGKSWSKENYKNGFTSYASANRLHESSSTFARWETLVAKHVAKFVKSLELDMGGEKLVMDTCWANVMKKNTHHNTHIHPLSVISGTYYVSAPKDAAEIKFEDPRLNLFMGSPPRKPDCKPKNRNFVSYPATPGYLVLFESWMRHEVPLHTSKEDRVSISFNYHLA